MSINNETLQDDYEYMVKERQEYQENNYNLPEGFIEQLHCTVRTCINCGCLVSGGPTRCTLCVREIEWKEKSWWKRFYIILFK